MSKIILLIGMPGCGKTHYGNQLSKETGYDFLDDLKDIQLLRPYLIENKPCIVADPWLCLPNILDRAVTMIKSHNMVAECIYWENDYEQCIKNVRFRNDGRKVDLMLNNLKNKYNPPPNAKKVHK